MRQYQIACGPEEWLDQEEKRLIGLPPKFCTVRVSQRLLLSRSLATPTLQSANGQVILVGRIFSKATNQLLGEIDTELAGRIVRSNGRALLDQYWGSYFLIVTNDGDGHLALRDPAGAMPAYYRVDGDCHFYFSCNSVAQLAGDEAVPDLDFAAQWLAFPFLNTARTGVTGVRELVEGTARSVVGSSASIDLAWSPWTFADRSCQILDFDDAVRRLRHTILQTVPLAVDPAIPPLLQLSGGLDSSIVAAALATSGRMFEAINYYTPAMEGDERRYARAVAEAAGAPLREWPCPIAELPFAVPERRLRPGLNPALRPLHAAFAPNAGASSRQLPVDGAGGDNIFCLLTTAAPVIDAWRCLGLVGALQTLQHVASLRGTTLWKTASAALVKARRGPINWRSDLRFMNPDAVPSAPEMHPWLAAPDAALVGKKEHVASLISIRHFLDRSGWQLKFSCQPLICQPMLELCLSIPSWLWVEGGRDRAVARAAMRGLVPSNILARRSKGRLEGLFFRSYGNLRSGLYELLLEGELASAKLVDSAAIRSYLDRGPTPGDDSYVRLLEIAALELWLQSWR